MYIVPNDNSHLRTLKYYRENSNNQIKHLVTAGRKNSLFNEKNPLADPGLGRAVICHNWLGVRTKESPFLLNSAVASFPVLAHRSKALNTEWN